MRGKQIRPVSLILAVLMALSVLTVPCVTASEVYVSENYVSVKDFGARGDGTTDDTKAIQAAVDAVKGMYHKGTVFFPAGTYIISQTIDLASGINILGTGDGSVIAERGLPDMGDFFRGIRVSDVRVEKLKFVSEHGRLMHKATMFECSKNITVANLRTIQCSAIVVNGYPGDISENFMIRDNMIEGLVSREPLWYSRGQGIVVHYTDNCVITGNRVENYDNGIQYWGGDANPAGQGLPENERWAKNLVISNNIVTDVGGAGIWGAMGENVTITNNIVTGCHDVGIDVEGTNYSTISNNVVYNCMNGGIVSFFLGRGMVVSGNTVYTEGEGQFAFKIYNTSLNVLNEDIVVTGNTFINNSPLYGHVGGETIEKMIYSDNVMVNILMRQSSNNSRFLQITGNQFILTHEMPFSVLDPSSQELFPLYTGNTNAGGQVIIQDNVITTYVPQREGNTAVGIVQADTSDSTLNIVQGNIIQGFDNEISLNNQDKRLINKHVFAILDNMFGVGKVKTSENAFPSYGTNYMTDGTKMTKEIPTTGYHEAGEILYYDSPDVTGYLGAVCVESGTPGVWKNFGRCE